MKWLVLKFDVTEPSTGVFKQVGPPQESASEAADWITKTLMMGSPNDVFAIIPANKDESEIRDTIAKAVKYDG